ncbi:TonB-dependent receptor [Novosphingobium album (ex Hu et al. 2023)]|uniref:TonB-dependent receptor n=1 Tax=Novosphingobium album (ex Hu et al. 2023) TaxID=2930093 RepID=A0ABT0B5N9_9SPHN|nr:TonB-dependent receptor [Novosphingobium album (ex Hu et al. 2023)]MCJ2180195.1 TonB-dependent receptor [Novosphingobium album (ex Hu et al. 2023)]
MLRHKKCLLASSALAWLAFAPHTALAQDSGRNGEEVRERGFTNQDIIVTARKVAENQQDVPVSITAFNGDTLEQRQIVGTTDLGKVTPNLEFTNNAPLAGNNNSSQVFIRGIGQIDGRSNVDPGVGLYVDDVYLGQSVGGAMTFRDIASVQILRGPQGTLFGRNTIGGAIVIATRDPKHEFNGEAEVGVGSDNLFEAFAAMDLPIVDTLAARITAGGKRQDGYVKRLYDGTKLGDTNTYSLTGKLLWEPDPAVTVRAKFDYTKADEHGAPLVFAAYNNNTDPTAIGVGAPESAGFMGAYQSVLSGCTQAFFVPGGGPGGIVLYAPGFDTSLFDSVPGVSWSATANGGAGAFVKTYGGPPEGYTAENKDPRCANNQWAAGPFANNGTGPVGSTLEAWGGSLNVEFDASDAITFKSITAYRKLNWTGKRDGDNTPFTILHTDYNSRGHQFSQELQGIYETERLTGVVGLYYFKQKVKDILTVALGERASLDSDNNIIKNHSWAAFTQWTGHLTDRLSVTGGIRYTEETKGSIPEQFDYASLAATDDTPGVLTPDEYYLAPILYEVTFKSTTVEGSVDYQWSDSFLTYARFAQGFKGGGWNSSFNVPQSQAALDNFHDFAPEKANSYEVGFKSDLFGKTLRFNASAFLTKYKDLQFLFRAGPAPYLLNAGKATIKGVEAELNWVPNSHWLIQGGVSYLENSIDTVVDLSGLGVSTPISTSNKLPYAPKFKWNLGVGYNTDVGHFSISPRADLSYRTKTYFDTANTPEISQLKDVLTVDASIRFESLDDPWVLTLSVQNLTDKLYPTAGNSSLTSGTGYAEIAYARPRQFMARLSVDF